MQDESLWNLFNQLIINLSTWLHRLYGLTMQTEKNCEICLICWFLFINKIARIIQFAMQDRENSRICEFCWFFVINVITRIKRFCYAGQGISGTCLICWLFLSTRLHGLYGWRGRSRKKIIFFYPLTAPVFTGGVSVFAFLKTYKKVKRGFGVL